MSFGHHRINLAINQGRIGIHPFNPDQVRPASYDVTLGDEMKKLVSKHIWIGPIPVKKSWLDRLLRRREPARYQPMKQDKDGYFRLKPGECALAHTVEVVRLDNSMEAILHGRSSIGRCFLTIHVTAGYIDPGFQGQITLELKNESPAVMYLKPGQRIGQLKFCEVDGCSVGYGDIPGSKYQHQSGATESRIERDLEWREAC